MRVGGGAPSLFVDLIWMLITLITGSKSFSIQAHSGINHEQMDANGPGHNDARFDRRIVVARPVVLSWDDVERDTYHGHAGHNVVLHEFAHKLMALTG